MESWQTVLRQSDPARHGRPFAHPVHGPPQSTALSFWLSTPSPQVAAWQVPFVQT
jgi:hypothetical protein